MSTINRSRGRRLLAAGLSAVLAAAGLVGAGTAANAAAPSPASVPDTLALAGPLASQKLTWEDCTFDPTLDPAVVAQLTATPGLSCATVTVPQDWHNPTNGKTFTVRVSQVKNLDQSSSAYKGTILVNPGGPGGTALHWAPNILRRAPELKANYNVIGIDPRGVGQSEAPECLAAVGDGSIFDDQAPEDRARIVGETCSKIEAITKITTEQTVYDFDFIRGLLGIPKITYIGYSYGTWLGTWYGTVFGPKIERMILDSAIDGTEETLQATWDLQPYARDRQFRDAMTPYTARIFAEEAKTATPNDIAYYRPTDPAEVQRLYYDAVDRLNEESPRLPLLLWLFMGGLGGFSSPDGYPTSAGVVKYFVDDQLQFEATQAAPADPAAAAVFARASVIDQVAPALTNASTSFNIKADEFEAAAKTALTSNEAADVSAAIATLRPQIAAAEAEVGATDLPLRNAYDAFDAIRCGDGQWTQGADYWDAWAAKTDKEARFTKMFNGLLYPACGFWETDNPTKPAPNKKTFPQTLVIQAEEDSQTGYEGGYASGTQLPNTALLLVDNSTKHGYFPYRTACVDTPAFSFLNGAQLKTNKPTICQGKPLPGDDRTYEMWSTINVNGKHNNGKSPSRVQDPETGLPSTGLDISAQLARAETAQLIRSLVSAE